VIVGAGPAGLEAARVSAERGHAVVVFEAANNPGGQIRLTAQSERRREMISIIDWRMSQCEKHGVTFHFNTWAEAETIEAENPDVVIIATGGLPHTDVLTKGNELVVSSWDIISGDVKPGTNVLIFDDAGDHAGLQAAEFLAKAGAKVEIMTPDRVRAGSHGNEPRALHALAAKARHTFTVTYRLDPRKRAAISSSLTSAATMAGFQAADRRPDRRQPWDHPARRPLFRAEARVEQFGRDVARQLLSGQPQTVVRNPEGKFQLFRIGDAVAARNTHAAIYEDVWIGATLMAPNVRYPDHAHPPEESYLVLSEGEFQSGQGNWFSPGIGGSFYNSPGIKHAMRSGKKPLFAFWALLPEQPKH
jgi:hypothetical protein